MRPHTKSITIIVFLLLTSSLLWAQSRVEIQTEMVELKVGESFQVEAVYFKSAASDDTLDVDFRWFVNPGYLGSVDPSGLFTAEHPGKGVITVKYRQTEASVDVVIDAEDDDANNDGPGVTILNRHLKLVSGDSLQMVAVFKDSAGDEVDTTFTWSVEPAHLGEFKEPTSGMFYALEAGEGIITAAVGPYSDRLGIEVKPSAEKDDDNGPGNDNRLKLRVLPHDTTVIVGEAVQFSVQYKAKGNTYADTTGTWSLAADPVGPLTSDTGLLQTTAIGLALVKVKVGESEATAEVRVIDDPDVPADGVTNTIQISRVLPDGHVLPPHEVREGGVYQLGGLPYPLDLLNGGRLHFPEGCLHEDIAIHILLPESAKEDTSGVSFADSSVNGARFVVMLGDSTASPFYFDVPLNMALPFKHGRLQQMGLSVDDLGLYFAEESSYNLDGLTHVTVDSATGKIYFQVAHFSTIVIRDKKESGARTNIDSDSEQLPADFSLEQNYPNPFNPETAISYRIDETAQVEITVYNHLGRRIKTLVKQAVNAGSHEVIWNGRDAKGVRVASGVYFYDMKMNGKRLMTRQMVLIK